jgi:hypothetical protein
MNLKEYFSIHPSERYQNYVEHISEAARKRKAYITDGMLHFDDESARIWGGPFPGSQPAGLSLFILLVGITESSINIRKR